MQGHLSKLQTRLKNTNKEMKYYTESIDINLMSSNQLNTRSKVLTNTLNALSKEAEPDRWNELNNELIKVRRRMDEVRVGALGRELLSNFVSLIRPCASQVTASVL